RELSAGGAPRGERGSSSGGFGGGAGCDVNAGRAEFGQSILRCDGGVRYGRANEHWHRLDIVSCAGTAQFRRCPPEGGRGGALYPDATASRNRERAPGLRRHPRIGG